MSKHSAHQVPQGFKDKNEELPYENPSSKNYMELVKDLYSRKSYLPSYEIKYELGAIREKLLQEKQIVIAKLRQHKLVEETISEQELQKYHAKKRQSLQYNKAIETVRKIKAVFKIIQQDIPHFMSIDPKSQFDQNNQQSIIKNTNLFLHQEQQSFARLILGLEEFNNFFIEEGNEGKSSQNSHLPKDKLKFVKKLYSSLIQQIQNNKNQQVKSINLKLAQIIKTYNIPVKRNQKPKERENIKINPVDKLFLQKLLHREACQFALHTYLSNKLNALRNDQQINQQKENYPKAKQDQKQLGPFKSLFFQQFYEKIQASIKYLFIGQNESHSFDEPNWMFEYIQQVFTANYQWLRTNILSNMETQSQGNILVYLLQFSITNLFYKNIKERLEIDLKSQEFISSHIHYYKFLDSLYELEEKLNITFGQQFSLMENLLVQFEINKQHKQPHENILQRCFDYEHQWIEQKIFKDFWQNINYSSIDLKNIETYNIVTNFNVLFEKLYTKFSTLYEPKIVQKVFAFYQQQIKNLIAHIKTSLERIFYHSGLDKLSVILAFKRVDNEFRSGLSAFTSKDLEFQKYIKKEYYDYILQLFNELAVEQLAIYSRKTLKAVTELEHFFTAESITEQDNNTFINRSQQIYKKWSTKLEELNLIYPTKDPKIKNQFFVFLQSINFTQKGISLFLQFYQPFLKVFYNSQIFNMLKMVILMDKKQQLQFLRLNSGGNLMSLLLETQINAIKRMKIK